MYALQHCFVRSKTVPMVVNTAEWDLDKCLAAGLSRAAYCRLHNLKVSQFQYYFERAKKMLVTKKSPFARVVATTVATLPAPILTSRSARLMFGGNVALEIDAGTDPVWLAHLITSVGRQS